MTTIVVTIIPYTIIVTTTIGGAGVAPKFIFSKLKSPYRKINTVLKLQLLTSSSYSQY